MQPFLDNLIEKMPVYVVEFHRPNRTDIISYNKPHVRLASNTPQ